MKRFLLFSPVITMALLALTVLAINMGAFHDQLQEAVATKTGSKVKLGALGLVPAWPIRFSVGASQIESPAYLVQWQMLILEIGSLWKPYAVTIKWNQPKFELLGDYVLAPRASSPGGGPAGTAAETPLNLKVTITGGDFKTPAGHLTALDLDFEQKLLLKSPAKIHAKAFVEAQEFPLRFPLAIDSDNLTLSMEAVKATDLKISLGGLSAAASGTSLLNESRHRWKAVIAAPDLSQLPEPPMNIPATGWKGSMQLNAELVKEGAAKPWSVEGAFNAENVSANVKYHADKLMVQGPFSLDLQSQFRYVDGAPGIPNLKGRVDLTQTHIVYQDILQKAPGIPFSAVVSAQGDLKLLQLQNLAVEFWQFNAKINGTVQVKAPFAGDLQFAVPTLSMAGAEKILLPLSASPVTGDVALRGRYTGPLMEPKKARIAMELLRLKDFAANVDYDKPGMLKAKGPVKFSLEGKGEINKGTLQQAELKGRVNLSETALVAGPLRKEARQVLSAEFQARNAGSVLEVQNLSVDSFAGRLRVGGKITNPFDPVVQIKVELQPLNLSELRMALPDWRELIPKGTVSGQVSLSGHQDKAKPWHDWPLTIDGGVSVNLPEYTLASAPPAKEKPVVAGKVPPTAVANDSFLPNGFLTNHLKMKMSVDLGSVTKDKLVIKGVHSEGTISGGHFKGAAAIKEIFSGGVQATALDVPLIFSRPVVQGTVKWQEIVIQEATRFAKPEFKDFATGRMAGSTEFQTYLPADADFMNFLKAKGDVAMQPVTLNSVKVGQMINDLAKQLPMVKLPPAKLDPLHGSVTTHFDMRNQTLQIENFVAKDLDGSELQLKGKVVVPTLQGDLVGNFFWVQNQVKGCLLEGNSDANGRMIIPVAIKGDLMHPGLASLSDLVSKLGGKALDCEQKKLVEKLKKEGTKGLEDEVKKKLQGIFGQ